MKPDVNEPVLGKLLNGRYQILKVLSAGAFGQTYVAQDKWLEGIPQCVVKHIKPNTDHPRQWQICQRLFARETEILKKLGQHNQIPQFLDSFRDRQGFYLVQELIVGEPLSAELPLGPHCSNHWSEEQCLELLNDVLGILEFVHEQGVIHCDLKPNNLIRRISDNKLVLIDFGVAYQVDSNAVNCSLPPLQASSSKHRALPDRVKEQKPREDSSSTAKPDSLSSSRQGRSRQLAAPVQPLGYIPAEQFSGQPHINSDLYALGTIAIEALTGLSPLELKTDPNTGELDWQHHVSVSGELASVLDNMVRRDFRERYQSAADVRVVLKHLVMKGQEPEVISPLSDFPLFDSLTVLQPSVLPTEEEAIALPARSPDIISPEPVLATTGVQDNRQLGTSTTWEYARELASAFWPKLPPVLTGLGAGMATSNALAISFGLYTLLHTASSNPGLDLLVRAMEQYQEGNLDEAIALAKSVPNDSSAYQESVAAVQKWRSEWSKASLQFQAVQDAFNDGRWQDVLEEARQAPNIAYWQQQIEPFVAAAKPELEHQAQELLQQAYQQARQKDFTAALNSLKQIYPETPTGTKIKPKLAEYQQKQQVKADALLQKAYELGAQRDFSSALKYLAQISEDTPAYEKAQIKLAEYSQKQDFKEAVEQQVMLAEKLPNPDQKIAKLPQNTKTSKKSGNLNPGNHFKEVSPQPVVATPVKR
ncbi:MAG TPA: serine/threonine-protein kinase [Chroococcales cyanobacterium]